MIRPIAALFGTIALLFAAGAQAQELVVNSYGGPYEAIIKERIIDPFEKKFGVKVLYDAAGSASQDYAKIKASRGRPGFDVVVMTASQSIEGCKEKLLEPMSAKTVPNLAKLNPEVQASAGECGAVHEVQYLSLLYRTDRFPTPPDSWTALEKPELNKRIMLPTYENIMAVNLLQIFSKMNGGSLNEISRGFEVMKRLAKQTRGFEQSSAIMENYIKADQVWAMPFWSGRAQLMQDAGAPVNFIIPKEGSIPLIATLNIPVGSQNKAMALKFVNFFLEKSSQEAWADGYRVGSIRTDIEVPESVRGKQIMTQTELNKLHLPNVGVIQTQLRSWGDTWQREVVPAARP